MTQGMPKNHGAVAPVAVLALQMLAAAGPTGTQMQCVEEAPTLPQRIILVVGRS